MLGGLAIFLVVLDYRYQALGVGRMALSTLTTPFHWLSDVPARVSNWSGDHVRSRSSLLEENQALRAEALVLQGKVQKMAALTAENIRLRALLNSTAIVDDSVLITELIGVSPDPSNHQVLLNKGLVDRVYEGQPVLDAHGLIGQIVEVSRYVSRAMLITDATHAIPVQVNRNGVRAIAEGVGLLDELELKHVAATTDIQPGDILVSSGLGQVFPVGYPVAIVEKVEHDPGQSFLSITARPSAHLDRSRHVLLVFTGGDKSGASGSRISKPDDEQVN